jgi:hypothetical protein
MPSGISSIKGFSIGGAFFSWYTNLVPKRPRYKKVLRLSVLVGSGLLCFVIIAFFILVAWSFVTPSSPVKGHNDQYFYNLTTSMQADYQAQGAILGLDTGLQPSKTCAHEVHGGPAFGEATLFECHISVTAKITDPQAVAAAKNLVSSLKPVLKREGFQIDDPEQVSWPSGGRTALLWATINGDIGSLCTTEIDTVANYDGYGNKELEYSLSCSDATLDTPPEFTYTQ